MLVARFFLLGLASAALLGAVTATHAEPLRMTKLPMIGGGNLEIQVPVTWRNQSPAPDEARFPTLKFASSEARGFRVLFTPFIQGTDLPPPRNLARRNGPRGDSASALAIVESTRKTLLPRALESNPRVSEFAGPEGPGYFVTVTDQRPGTGPEDFRFMRNGALPLDGCIVVFTVLANDASSPVFPATLAALQTARCVPNP